MLLFKDKLVVDFHEIYKKILRWFICFSNKISPPFRGFDQVFETLLVSPQIHLAPFIHISTLIYIPVAGKSGSIFT
jgi:hypothetical protein